MLTFLTTVIGFVKTRPLADRSGQGKQNGEQETTNHVRNEEHLDTYTARPTLSRYCPAHVIAYIT